MLEYTHFPQMKRQNTANRGQIAIQRGWRRCRRACLLWLVVVLALLACAVPAQAQFLVRQVNLAELTQRAEFIVEGRVVEVRREGHPDYPNVPTLLVTLEVLDNIRGAAGERFSFRQYLDEIELQTARPGEAPVAVGKYSKHGYAVGQELLLFLYPNSRYGLTSPIGAGQGRFRVMRDREGRRTVLNDFGNRGLFQDVAAGAQKAGLIVSPAESRLLQQPAGAADMETFVSLVKRLAAVRSAP